MLMKTERHYGEIIYSLPRKERIDEKSYQPSFSPSSSLAALSSFRGMPWQRPPKSAIKKSTKNKCFHKNKVLFILERDKKKTKGQIHHFKGPWPTL